MGFCFGVIAIEIWKGKGKSVDMRTYVLRNCCADPCVTFYCVKPIEKKKFFFSSCNLPRNEVSVAFDEKNILFNVCPDLSIFYTFD